MHNPISTYRIQFHSGFTFRDLDAILPYLQKLGVKTIYASPVLEATPGSTHGYDGLNPHRINGEIGTEEELYALSKKVKEAGMLWLQDIVPNHMAFDPRNPWLLNVLEKGMRSPYALFFDIHWQNDLEDSRLMVPFLGTSLQEAIQNGALKISYNGVRFVLQYYETAYPLSIASYNTILSLRAAARPAISDVVQQIQQTIEATNDVAFSKLFQNTITQLAEVMADTKARAFVEEAIAQLNENPSQLAAVADEQVYRLCHWQETDERINYRRFFTVNGLICLNMQHAPVFEAYHSVLKKWVQQDIFQGLRVDHIDGLYDPQQYLQRLREAAGEETYIVVEKILEAAEKLPTTWPVQGTTGYDFLAFVNGLFTNAAAKKPFTQFYYSLTADQGTVPQQVRDKKEHILYEHMAGELENLYQLFLTLELVPPDQIAQLPEGLLKKTIGAFLVHCPVYRFYGNSLPLALEEAAVVQAIFNTIQQADGALKEGCTLLAQIFFNTPYADDESYTNRAIQFYQRCMQFSGPLMAKGVEDTLMYTFYRFVGHNEVGDAPGAFGISPEEFHQQMQDRQTHWPLTMNTTATHDTKRGEDFRARLNVVTDLPDVWLETMTHWQQLNSSLKVDGTPDSNDEYFIYQTLAGSYPLDEASEATYSQRLQAYLQKALREAKQHSNWTAPNEAYETATLQFATALLQKDRPFWKSFQKLLHKISDFGLINALAQVALKYTCPGVPDTYRGSEQWDFNFVDPDNRRTVDYGLLKKVADAFSETLPDEKTLRQLWADRHDARIKFFFIQALLRLRNEAPDLFVYGDYIPLKVEGIYKNNVLAFARKYKQDWCVVVVPLHLAALVHDGGKKKTDLDWKDTKVLLPKEVKIDWQDVVQGRSGKQRGGLLLKTLFKNIPVAVLKMQGKDNKRSAGILMHLTSLPSAFGIGDLGPEATRFADFLQRSQQRYWQLLPINPTENGQSHSPYSSTSSRAGNVLLISPELLVKEGLLTKEQLRQYEITNEGKVDYSTVERVKMELLDWAWNAFKTGAGAALQKGFEQFKNDEEDWLQPFALYAGLKKLHNGKPWFQWPEAYKNGTPEALQEFEKGHHKELENIKWLQFLFARQWKALKGYCNARNIQLLGDLPIYVSYDSADVWANKKLFKLDAEGGRIGLAGVPPDAFSDDGQLWGMPVYDWAILKEDNYSWWIDRLRKNSQLFDVIRLDHFRAFADYWEVPAGETTAKNGVWNEGPGASFFAAVQAQLGTLPFVAEDLGEINEGVIQLRDAFGLPGMKILQFAFGDDVATSDYMPHNYTPNFIAYTGTHDNNTTRGWFRQEVDAAIKSNLEKYLAQPVSEENIAFLLCRMAFASVAKTAILPIQDVLNLNEQARMNTPASGKNNWGWRLLPGQLTEEAEARLREWTIMYNRD